MSSCCRTTPVLMSRADRRFSVTVSGCSKRPRTSDVEHYKQALERNRTRHKIVDEAEQEGIRVSELRYITVEAALAGRATITLNCDSPVTRQKVTRRYK